jgi:hypothetical protein
MILPLHVAMALPTGSRPRAIGPGVCRVPCLGVRRQGGVLARYLSRARKAGAAACRRLHMPCAPRLAPVLGRDRLPGQALDVGGPDRLLGTDSAGRRFTGTRAIFPEFAPSRRPPSLRRILKSGASPPSHRSLLLGTPIDARS